MQVTQRVLAFLLASVFMQRRMHCLKLDESGYEEVPSSTATRESLTKSAEPYIL